MVRPRAKGKKPAGAQGSGGKGKAKAPQSRKRKSNEKSVNRDVYSDDDDDEKEERMNAQMDIDGIYEYEQPETFENDSEIDEDEAFDSEDEEQFGMFFNKTGNKKLAADSATEEEEDEGDDDEGGGGDLLSDLLGTAPASRLSTVDGPAKRGHASAADDDDDDDVFDASDDEDDDEQSKSAKQQALLSLVDGLVPQKKKKKLTEITEESISAASVANGNDSEDVDGGELTLSSLLGGAAVDGEDKDTSSVDLRKVKKQIRDLEVDAEQSGALSASIAPIQEARATRKLAYEEKKKDLDLFQPVVKRNRKKETMDFREQIPKMENLTSASLASKFSAETSLEKDVEALLKAGALSDRNIAKDEHDELLQKKVSAEEVLQRQKELSKLRSMMFYEEQKARRVKKIKSKLYHKIRNNQNKKEADKAREQLRELDPELAKQLDEELAEKRAEERMSLKHTNTSKWVKHQLKRGTLADDQTRGAIAEQLRRGAELRRKMHTANSDDEDDDDEDGDDEMDGEMDAVSRLHKRLTKQANALVTEIDEDEANADKVKGLAGMKFMQRAVQKQREKARSEAEKLLREIKGEDGLLSDGDGASSSDDDATKRKTKKQRTAVTVTDADKAAVARALPKGALQTGTVSMDKGLSARASGAIAVDLGDGSSASVRVETAEAAGVTVEVGKTATKSTKKKADTVANEETPAAPVEAEENPWLNGGASKSKKRKKKGSAKQAETGADVGSAMEALTKTVANKASKDDGAIDIAKAAAAAVTSVQQSKKRKLEETPTTTEPVDDADKTTTNSKKAKKTKELSQQEITQEELVRRAFAFADEDENEIAQEKEEIAAQDTQAKKGAEMAKLVGMTGWGSWAGVGVQKSFRQTKREELAKKMAEDTKKAVLAARKDAKMERVLINEKKDKRSAKFTVQEVPYPFTSREEYEMAMRNPLGSDWNTQASTNALTAPKLIKRAGQKIDPLKLNKEDKKQAKKELSKQRKAKF